MSEDKLYSQQLEMIRRFFSHERVLVIAVVNLALLFAAVAIISLNTDNPELTSASWPLLLFSIIFLIYTRWLWLRIRARKTALKTSSAEDYLNSIESTTLKVERTRDISAIVLLVTIVGLIMSCLILDLIVIVSAWIASVVCSALLSLIAYYHAFRLDIHAQDVRRSIRVGERND